MDKRVKEDLEFKKPLPKELEKIMLGDGVLTGSYILGGYNPETSDIDLVMLFNDKIWEDFYPFAVLIAGSVEHLDNFYTMYVKTDTEKIFNITFIKKQKEYDAWIKAQHLMIQLTGCNKFYNEMIKDKSFRVRQFESFREFFGWEEYSEGPKKEFDINNLEVTQGDDICF